MGNKLITVVKKSFRNLSEFFNMPSIQAITQANPITAGISAYLGGKYSNYQYETLETFLHLLHSKVQRIENQSIDKDFIETTDGKRIIGKVFRAVLRDNRKEKLIAMSNLTVNLHLKSKLSLDEKELYVDILDSLNSLQLSILQKVVIEMRGRTQIKHRGFGWEKVSAEYEEKGITKPLILQSIRVLESNGLVNNNSAIAQEVEQTHFITEFGEQFYDFISDVLKKGSLYL